MPRLTMHLVIVLPYPGIGTRHSTAAIRQPSEPSAPPGHRPARPWAPG